MTKTKSVTVQVRMTELQASELDFIRKPEETRSAAIRRLISDAWFEAMGVANEDYPSISDRENCL